MRSPSVPCPIPAIIPERTFPGSVGWPIVVTRHIPLPALVMLSVACSPADTRGRAVPLPEIVASVAGGTITAPDTVHAGWTRLRVNEDGEGHILVVFRFHDDSGTDSSVGADSSEFLAALDTAPNTPPAAVALGGPEIGDTGEVILRFRAGRHLIACVRRAEDGHRHASLGEAKMFVVVDRRDSTEAAQEPIATDTVTMMDFAYGAADRWPAGRRLVRVENTGQEDHQLRIVRLRDSTMVTAWLRQEESARAEGIAGVARMGAGEVAYLPLDLAAGTYVMHCLVAGRGEGKPHIEMGMFKVVKSE